MKPTATIIAELAAAFGLRPAQVRAIARLGTVDWRDRNTALRTIRAVKMPLKDAAAIWGFAAGAGMLGKHAAAGNLRLANGGERYSRANPRRVTIRYMLDLMDLLDRPSYGFRS